MLAHFVEFLYVEYGKSRLLGIFSACCDGAPDGVDDGTASLVDDVVGINAHAVHSHQVALILYGAGTDECVPGQLARGGPVGNEDDGVVLSCPSVARPYGETQVVAGEQQETDAAPFYDDRLLVKPVPAAIELLPDATRELPYEGAKEMILVEDVDNREFLCELVERMWEELPETKKKK